MDSFGALKNNSFGDFNKEDVLGFIDEMTHKTKKAEIILRDRVDVLNREREHLVMKVNAFDKLVADLEQYTLNERDNIRTALAEKDELRKKISVERGQHDSLLIRKQKELMENEREIMEFVREREELNARLSELESKSRRYDDIKASVDAIRLDSEPDAADIPEQPQEAAVQPAIEISAEAENVNTVEQGQVMEAVNIIDDIAVEVESVKQQLAGQDSAEEPAFSIPSVQIVSEPEPAAEAVKPDAATSEEPDDPFQRLNALYKALDESMERLQEIKTQFIQNTGVPANDGQ